MQNENAPVLTVQRLLDHLAAGKPAQDFAEAPGVNTLADLSLEWFGTDLNIATFKRLRIEGALHLVKYMDGEDHDGIDAVAVSELAVILRAKRGRGAAIERPDREAIRDARRLVLADGKAANENSVTLSGQMWLFSYGAEKAPYPARGNKCIGWLVKILRSPRHPLTVADLQGDPEKKLAADAAIGGERVRGGTAQIIAWKRRLQEIEDIDEAGASERLENEKAELLRQLRDADDIQQMSKPVRKAHHNIATQIRTFKAKLVKDMPELAAHLTAYLDLDFPHFLYSPPNGAKSWKI